ncbi:hypothetical protein PDE_03368 [Penicillium oxalicum 114-2]|uniref:Uncharacterized protein n=1 Tax=Penicillium oxalicum (strain 114-2 / CGMCC 5302) TaxID=933388 RepID=S8B211_PENO1|nr:hypothetical protein PDE_03368 [Penicillium oxalicum 114-2]
MSTLRLTRERITIGRPGETTSQPTDRAQSPSSSTLQGLPSSNLKIHVWTQTGPIALTGADPLRGNWKGIAGGAEKMIESIPPDIN